MEAIFLGVSGELWVFRLAVVQPEITEREGFMTCNVAHHQGAIETSLKNYRHRNPKTRLRLLSIYHSTEFTWVLFYTNTYSWSCRCATTSEADTQPSCSGKWPAPWATAAVGPRLPSQRCLILMQVNPTLTSSSPPWPIVSPTLPLMQSFSATLVSHPSQSPPPILYKGLISLSLALSLLLLTPPCCLSSFPHLRVALRRFQSPSAAVLTAKPMAR